MNGLSRAIEDVGWLPLVLRARKSMMPYKANTSSEDDEWRQKPLILLRNRHVFRAWKGTPFNLSDVATIAQLPSAGLGETLGLYIAFYIHYITQ